MIELDRLDVPSPGALPELRVGAPVRTSLDNRLALTVLPRPTVPRVEFRLTVPAGGSAGPGPATGELLRRGLSLGTRTMDQQALAEALHRLGGSMTVHQDQDHIHLAAAALSEAEAELYRILASVVTEPELPPSDLETEKAKLIDNLRVARATPDFVAAEALQAEVYQNHPYGRPQPSEEQVEATSRQTLLDFYRARFHPAAARITVVGDVEPETTRDRLARAFGGWIGAETPEPAPAVAAHRSPEVVLIDRPGSVQTVLMAGASTPAVGEPDYLPLELAVSVLGGGMESRLMRNLREDKGYAYSPHGRLESHLRDGFVLVNVEVRTEATAAALLEVQYELGRMATAGVPADELERTKRFLSGVRVLRLQTQSGLASTLASLQTHGLDQTYLEGYQRRLAEVGAEEVRQVAQRHLSPTALTMVLVGDADRIRDGLSAVSPVRVLAG